MEVRLIREATFSTLEPTLTISFKLALTFPLALSFTLTQVHAIEKVDLFKIFLVLSVAMFTR